MLLFVFTVFNIVCFFYIKNSTHYFKIELNNLNEELEYEKRNLSIQKSNFDKKYNIENLQEMAKNHLNLQLSNVKQIVDMEDIIQN